MRAWINYKAPTPSTPRRVWKCISRVQIGRLSSNAAAPSLSLSLSLSGAHSMRNYSGGKLEPANSRARTHTPRGWKSAAGSSLSLSLSCTHSHWHSRTQTRSKSAWWDANRILFACDFVIYAESANFSIIKRGMCAATEKLCVLYCCRRPRRVGAFSGGARARTVNGWMKIRERAPPWMECVRGRPLCKIRVIRLNGENRELDWVGEFWE